MALRLLQGVRRSFGSSAIRRGGHGHDAHAVDGPQPPNGFLFGEKPLLPGEKRVKEEWENVYVWGMTIAFVLGTVGYIYQPKEASVNHVFGQEAQARLAGKTN